MAVNHVEVLEVAQGREGRGEINWDTDTFSVILCDDSQALDGNFVGASGEALYSDLTGELAPGAGYATGGEPLTNPTWTHVGDYHVFDGDDVVWPALTATAKYAVILDETAPSDPFVTHVIDLDTGGSGLVIPGTDFQLIWSANGIARKRQNPPS